jgi:hypothetical protein
VRGREGENDSGWRKRKEKRRSPKGDSDGRIAGKEGATPRESSTERGARDSENPNEQRAKRGRGKEEEETAEGIESARRKLEDSFIRFKTEGEGGNHSENPGEVSGGSEGQIGEDARHREDRGTTEPGDSHEKRRSRPREQERRAAENVGNSAENDRGNRDGGEKEAEPHRHVDRSGGRMERGRDCRGGLPEERMDSEHKHKERIQRDLQVLGQEAMPEVPEREPDIRSGTTSPQSPHREAEDRGGADHGLRGRDGPGDKMFQLQRLRTYRQELSAETEVPQMRQGRPQNQRVQSRKIGMRELQADRAQSLRQEVPHDEEGTRVEDRSNREVLNAQGLRDRIKVFQANLGR